MFIVRVSLKNILYSFDIVKWVWPGLHIIALFESDFLLKVQGGKLFSEMAFRKNYESSTRYQALQLFIRAILRNSAILHNSS
ncbi:MAG: hypothetical protein JWQ09_704 [Segetibacter sp.]|nr:hypothetical protein [Segetibacter sp.]